MSPKTVMSSQNQMMNMKEPEHAPQQLPGAELGKRRHHVLLGR